MNKYIYITLIIIPLKLAAGEALLYEEKVHSDKVDSLCVNKGEVYSASFDRSITKTVNNESKIIGKHKDWIRKVICTGSNVITASNDGKITIWNDVEKIRSVQAHSWWVTDIALSTDKIVSVSLDETVKVWSYPELNLLYSHKIYGSNKHYSVIINNGKAFIGSTHGLMFIIDLNNFKLLKQKNIANYYSVLISSTKSDKYIFFGGSDGFITKVSASTPYKVLHEKISDFPLEAITQSDEYLYIGDSNGVLRKINMENLNELTIINHSSEAVSAIAISNDFLYAGYNDGYIRIFNRGNK